MFEARRSGALSASVGRAVAAHADASPPMPSPAAHPVQIDFAVGPVLQLQFRDADTDASQNLKIEAPALDAARNVLLSRSGRLLDRLGVPPDQTGAQG